MLRWARRRRTVIAVVALCAPALWAVVHLTAGGGSSLSASGAQPAPYGAVSPGPRGVVTPATEPTTVSTVFTPAGGEVSAGAALRPTRGTARPVAPELWAYAVVGSAVPHQLVAYDLATGAPHPMGTGDMPTPSPNRTGVAYVTPVPATGVLQVRVAGPGGDAPRAVSDASSLEAGYCLAWSPDGRRLAFAAAAKGATTFDVFVAGPAGVTRLTVGAHVTGCSPETRALAWSADGGRLVFVSDLGAGDAVLETVDAATGTVRPVTRPADGGFGSPSWLPVGDVLVAQRSDDKLVTVDVATGQVHRITTGSADERAPAVSGYGGWVAYLRSGAVALVRLDGTGTRALTASGGAAPAPVWSGDGTALLLAFRGSGGSYTGFTRVAAGSPTVFIHRGGDYYAAW